MTTHRIDLQARPARGHSRRRSRDRPGRSPTSRRSAPRSRDAMRDDDRVFLLGEDIGVFGGAFGVTAGLLDEFGEDRVIDTPIAEEGFVGAAIGAAWMGERPVVELQFADFITCAFDPIVTVAAKTHWRSGQAIPITIRCPTGGGVRGGPFHAGSPEGWFVGTAGLKVVCPGTVDDAYGLLRSRDRGSRSRPLLRAQAALPDAARRTPRTGASRTPIGPARDRTHRERTRRSSPTARASARPRGRRASSDARPRGGRPAHDLAARRGRDPRVGREDLARARAAGGGSLDRRRRCRSSRSLARRAFEHLDAPPALHAPPDTPVPFAPELEDAYLPSVDSTVAALEELLAY